MASSNIIVISDTIYRSRINLLEMLKYRGCNVEDYNNFTKDDVTNMLSSYGKSKDVPELGSLDMLVTDSKKNKIYVKYYLEKFKQSKSFDKLVNDIYTKVLKTTDTLIFILSETVLLKAPKDNKIEDYMQNMYLKKKYFIQFFGLENFLFNTQKHNLSFKHEKLEADEIKEFMTKYNISSLDELKKSKLPIIRVEDNGAKYIGLRPGNICKISYPSQANSNYVKYRICLFK